MSILFNRPASQSSSVEPTCYRMFIIAVGVVLAIFISGIFYGMIAMNRQVVRDELVNRAKTDIHLINTMRKWNAHYGGVLVEKLPDVETNPYVKDAEINAVDGRIYTRKHPSLMTREISDILRKDDGDSFHITSLNPINPGNSPDPNEANALKSFESGSRERSWIEEINGKTFFRYMAPLKVDQLCLKCHADQGYKIGDIRGGISVQFNIDKVEAEIQRNTRIITLCAVASFLLLMGLILFFFRKLIAKLTDARRQLEDHATTDSLTGTLNRRSLMHKFEQEVARISRSNTPLSCMLLDLDYFKNVNDSFGHNVGDEMLVKVAEMIKGQLRSYDIFGRYGGEEFFLVLPDLDIVSARATAERLRQSVHDGITLPSGEALTLSIGVATCSAKETISSIIQRADEALYKAKSNGRNRVEVIE